MAGSFCLELLIIQTKHRHITGNPQQKIVVISSNLFLQCVWLTSLVVHMDNCLNINFVISHHGIKRAKSRDVRHVIQVRYFGQYCSPHSKTPKYGDGGIRTHCRPCVCTWHAYTFNHRHIRHMRTPSYA